MRLFKKVAIVGTGLIGGSIALAIKEKRLASEVIGVSRHKKNIILAKRMGAIDKGGQQIDIIRDADLLILAAPVHSIINLAPAISNLIRKSCIVTDVGSTKAKIVSSLEKIFPNYVGSHPLAGSEKRSVANASPGILKNSLCILTPTSKTNKKAVTKLNLFWEKLGVRTVVLSPETHDKILAFISHLPHVAAFSLMASIPGQYLKFSSSGLKDTTRIAASDSELWADIFLSNRGNILKGIGLLQNNLSVIQSAVQRKDKKQLIKFLIKAADKRKRLDST